MESRKIVLMNLFTEKKWRHRHRERSGGNSRKESVGQTEKAALTYMHSLCEILIYSWWEAAI